MIVDLHCHSIYSDGELKPSELLDIALANQVEILALTDHDTLDGFEELNQLASAYRIQIVPGIECSVTWQKMELHILAYNVDPASKRLKLFLQQQFQRRWARALLISDALRKLGFSNNLQKVIEIAGHYGLSRTHFAKYLVQNQYVPDSKVAFKKYLGSHGKAFIPPIWATLEETIAVIREAGGQAVIAHPLHYSLSTAQLKGLFKAFKSLGGSGIEVISGIMNLKDMQRLIKLTNSFDLKLSSGSDFHKPQIFRASLGQQTPLPEQYNGIWLDWSFQSC